MVVSDSTQETMITSVISWWTCAIMELSIIVKTSGYPWRSDTICPGLQVPLSGPGFQDLDTWQFCHRICLGGCRTDKKRPRVISPLLFHCERSSIIGRMWSGLPPTVLCDDDIALKASLLNPNFVASSVAAIETKSNSAYLKRLTETESNFAAERHVGQTQQSARVK